MDPTALAALLARRAALYDKDREEHYNLISALHKSLRGSDPDAALYWFARMLNGGEDPRYIARRLVRFAAEDIGMADPNALTQALAGWETYGELGSPEGELAIAQVVIYLGAAPKSNAIYTAYSAARASAKATGSLMPPSHILNAPTRLMKDLGYGAGYQYDHEADEAFSGQNYFPDGMAREQFYHPRDRGFEREITKRLDYWASCVPNGPDPPDSTRRDLALAPRPKSPNGDRPNRRSPSSPYPRWFRQARDEAHTVCCRQGHAGKQDTLHPRRPGERRAGPRSLSRRGRLRPCARRRLVPCPSP
jgi:hypothetical protein